MRRAGAGPGPSHSRSPGPIRVLWLLKGLGGGGTERLILWTASLYRRDVLDCRLAYVLSSATDLVDDVEATGVPVVSLGARHDLDLRWMVRLRRLLQSRPVDVVHSHSPYVAGLGRLVVRSLPRGRRPRLVSTEHNLWSDYNFGSRSVNALTLGLDDVTLAVSGAVRDSVAPRFRDRVRVLLPGVPVEDLRAGRGARSRVRAELGIAEDEVMACTIAHFRAQKDYPGLLRAARRVLDGGLPMRFVAVGQGPLERQLHRLHRDLDLGHRFAFLGYRPDAAVIMAASDLFVLPSRYEGLPVALLEALAMGLPVAATRVGAVPDLVTDGVEGRVVPPGDPGALADAIADVVAGRDRMAAAASERGKDLDVTHTVRALEAVYGEALR